MFYREAWKQVVGEPIWVPFRSFWIHYKLLSCIDQLLFSLLHNKQCWSSQKNQQTLEWSYWQWFQTNLCTLFSCLKRIDQEEWQTWNRIELIGLSNQILFLIEHQGKTKAPLRQLHLIENTLLKTIFHTSLINLWWENLITFLHFFLNLVSFWILMNALKIIFDWKMKLYRW